MNTTIGCPIPGASQPKEQPKTIVERIGEPAFLEQLAEECSELAQAALKTARKYRSDKPAAKPFRKWVTAKVLPAIRKNGGYIANQETMTDAELMSQALLVAQKTLEARTKRLEELAAANKQLESENAEMSGKAQYFDAVIDRNLLTNFRTFASELHIKQTVLVQFLLDKKYLYRDTQGKLKAYAERNDGLFDIKEFVNRGNGHAGTQTLITPKGRETFRLLMEAEGLIDMPDDAEDMADAG